MIEVVSDASVALTWFHADGEAQVGPARALVRLHAERAISLSVLDLTAYEVGNALLRGRAGASAVQVAAVLDALERLCPRIAPTTRELRHAARIAEQHELTIYDAAYAAVAAARGAELATMDDALLTAGLGRRPSVIIDVIGGH